MNGPHNFPTTNESLALSMNARLPKKYSNLARLEAGLGRARASIREAKNWNQTIEDHDYVPIGPMYWNSKTFHRYPSVERLS